MNGRKNLPEHETPTLRMSNIPNSGSGNLQKMKLLYLVVLTRQE